MSEQTTPEDCKKQEGGGDPLTSPSPAASLTPHPPAGVHSELYESSEEPTERGFSCVPLDQPAGVGGTQQVSTEAQQPASTLLPSPAPASSITNNPLSAPIPSPVSMNAQQQPATDPLFPVASSAVESFPSPSPCSPAITPDQPVSASPTFTPSSTKSSVTSEELIQSPSSVSAPSDVTLNVQDPLSITPPLSNVAVTSESLPSVPSSLSPVVSSVTKESGQVSSSSILLSSDSVAVEELPSASISSTSHSLDELISAKEQTISPPLSSVLDKTDGSLSTPLPPSTIEESSPILQPSSSYQELPASPPPSPTSGVHLDHGMTLPQELSSELSATLVDAPCVDTAAVSSLDEAAEEASTLDTVTNDLSANDAVLDDQPLESNSYNAPPPQLGTDPTCMQDAPAFLGDGDTTPLMITRRFGPWLCFT